MLNFLCHIYTPQLPYLTNMKNFNLRRELSFSIVTQLAMPPEFDGIRGTEVSKWEQSVLTLGSF